MCPNEPGQLGMIVLERKSYRPPIDQVHEEECLVVKADATVVDFLEVVIKNGRDRYVFSPNSEGCRLWLSTLTDHLVEAGLIQAERMRTLRTSKGALRMYWKDPEGLDSSSDQRCEERAMEEGVFFARRLDDDQYSMSTFLNRAVLTILIEQDPFAKRKTPTQLAIIWWC